MDLKGNNEPERTLLRATLFAQIFKISTALSIIKLCPKDVDIVDFSIALQKEHKNYNRLKDDLYYQSSKLRLFSACNTTGFSHIEDPTYFANGVSSQLTDMEKMSKWSSSVSSIRVGLTGLLRRECIDFRDDPITPLLYMLFQISLSVATFSNSHTTDLVYEHSSIIRDIRYCFSLTGKLGALSEMRKTPKTALASNLKGVISVMCIPRDVNRYDIWLPLVSTFLTSYTRSLRENIEEIGRPVIANTLTDSLLNLLTKRLRASLKDSNARPHQINEAFARIYTFLIILLGCFQRRDQFEKNLLQRTMSTLKEINNIDLDMLTRDTFLNNGSLGLLQTIKNKIHGITESLI